LIGCLIKKHFENHLSPIKFGVCLIPAGKSFEKEDLLNDGRIKKSNPGRQSRK
jgi:hypothetical protein